MYQVKYQVKNLTPICRIGVIKECGDEWSSYRKTITLTEIPKFATIKVNADGICGIYVNGEFVEAHLGRMPNRIVYVEITSKLRVGENEIKLISGSHYYQESAVKIYNRRGSWFSFVAAEVKIETKSNVYIFPTDETWICSGDGCEFAPSVFSEVTQGEYERFWNHAALWSEVPETIQVPEEVAEVAGDGYRTYLASKDPRYAKPKVLEENDTKILYDFGRLEVGYTTIEYEAECDTEFTILYDYSESENDFIPGSEYWTLVERLKICVPLKKGRHTLQLIRRRACRFMMVDMEHTEGNVKIHNCKMLLSMTPATKKGWFHCSEELLNDIWEVGKHTLQVNKHQEYESCPRYEMKFFSGDGIMDALIDYYVFGYPELTDASLSCTELEVCLGLRYDIYSRNCALWDYSAWRIIMAYNQYLYFADDMFLKHYYEEMVNTLAWMTEKVGSDNLMYQYPIYSDAFFKNSGSVEYTCSFDRIGQKTYLNALLYKSLLCMSELGEIMGDERSSAWKEFAEDVRVAINEKLWSNEMGCYIDLQYPNCSPQDGNALAVLFGVADEERTKLVLQSLKERNWSEYGSTIVSERMKHTRNGNETISPLMCTYEAEARFVSGDSENALELIRRCWGSMLKKGAGTFWEFAPNNGKDRWPIPSHSWSAGCTYLLSAYVLGIHPAEVGYNKVLFKPCTELESFEGVVPTARGYVAVKCRTENNKKRFVIALPEDMNLEVQIPEGCEVETVRYKISNVNI